MEQKITVEHIDGVTIKTDKRGDGFYEILVVGPASHAVISRQCDGGKWCVYPYGIGRRPERFKTRAKALDFAKQIAKGPS